MRLKITGKGDKNTKGILSLNKQIVFAAKQSCVQCAQLSQTAVLHQIKHEFIVRRNWLDPSNKFGIHVRFTRDKNDLSATVETAADWLDDHETGATRTADQAGHHGPDPHITYPEGARPQVTDIIATKLKAWRILPNVSLLSGGSFRTSGRPSKAKGKRLPKFKPVPYFVNTKGTAIYERLPGHRLKLFYTLPKAVNIKRDSTVTDPTIDVVINQFGIVFDKLIAGAVASGKP